MGRHSIFIIILLAMVLFMVGISICFPTSIMARVKWTRTFGGANNDGAHSVQKTADGGYILGGWTYSYGASSADAWLIKTDSGGNETWSKTFGGTDYDYAYSVQQTQEGGYIVAGYTYSYGAGNADAWLVKTDYQGDEIWSKTFGGTDSDYANSVQQTTDGGHIVAGYKSDYAWLIKTDSDGQELWDKTFGGTYDYAESVQQTQDGGYIVAGYTNYYGTSKDYAWLIKTDSNGQELWSRIFDKSDNDIAHSVQQTQDGGYIVAGYTESYGSGSADVWLIKTDPQGNELWSKTFGGTDNDYSRSVIQTQDCGYIAAGWTESYGAGNYDAWLIKTDSQGNKRWSKTFGGIDNDYTNSVQQTQDGGYIVAGGTWSYGAGGRDAWLIKIINPIAYFVFSPLAPSTGEAVSFDTSNAEGNIVSYKWDFGDGNSSITPTANITHRFNQERTYTVILEVTDNNGDRDSFNKTIKVEKAEWIRSFGGLYGDYARSVKQTQDSGYIVTGWTASYGSGGYDTYLIKVDPKGNALWSRTYGGSNADYAYSVQQTRDGSYIMAGYTSSYGVGLDDVWLIKTDSQGNEIWNNTFGGLKNDRAYSVQQTADGGFIIVGYTESYSAGSPELYLIKTNSQGQGQWINTVGDSNYEYYGQSVIQTIDGGYIVTGYTKSLSAEYYDIFLIKSDSQGNVQWNRTFGGSDNDYAYSVQQTQDGGYILGGKTDSLGGSGYIIKTDSQGNEKYSRAVSASQISSIHQTYDHGYIATGVKNNDFFLIKISSSWNEEWTEILGGTAYDEAYSVQRTTDGGYIIAGHTSSYGAGSDDVWLVKIAPEIITKTLNFTLGWSPWSLPLRLTGGITSQELIADIPYARKITTWDTKLGRWLETTKTGNTITGDDFPIKEDLGYFILAEKEISYTFIGWYLIEAIIPELTYGWNYAKVFDPQKTITSYSFLKENPQAQQILSCSTTTGEWTYAMKGFFGLITGHNFTLEANMAYYIYCGQ